MAPKIIVTRFLKALNREDFELAHTCLADNMHFDGVLGKRERSEAYMTDMKKMKFKYNILKTFDHENDVCILYDIDMGNATVIFACGWYEIADEKIKNIKVVFDPRPLLDKEKS